jgi:FkbM family methyltransferase
LNEEAGYYDNYKVPTISLDSLFYNQKIDFIKIDCEGAE